ncbi:hypothetical protein TSUD_389030 [Trifolium subterraneum]|uniref:Uncharacterized protein n=1 Tax=Trifolium subterraneum TaxID=3900 RepID=A0A2Z6MYE6_TRISU|nr:hypothetical protein TSUD_389030 [Trifolium subterraneum]
MCLLHQSVQKLITIVSPFKISKIVSKAAKLGSKFAASTLEYVSAETHKNTVRNGDDHQLHGEMDNLNPLCSLAQPTNLYIYSYLHEPTNNDPHGCRCRPSNYDINLKNKDVYGEYALIHSLDLKNKSVTGESSMIHSSGEIGLCVEFSTNPSLDLKNNGVYGESSMIHSSGEIVVNHFHLRNES